ncbi:MAG TPA: hypothetical protein VGP33_07055, partial [Chloroflexota bacterium]|nr:hypothetical protein [Chloroflexota bacterium]
QRFRCLFQDGDRQAVLAALRAYQNADGGFGNALEPDLRGPDSQPVPAEMALRVLAEAGGDATTVARLGDWLVTVTTPEGGVPFVLPSVRRHPSAPWWQSTDNPPASINPTGSIAGLLSKFGSRHHWLEGAIAYCWRALDALQPEMHDVAAAIAFLEHVPDRERAERAFKVVGSRLLEEGLVTLNPADSGYVKKPLDWAPTPDSICRRLFTDEVIATHLDALEAAQDPDGGWTITWPPVSAACELEWRGALTVDALRTLRAYDRLPG